MEQGMTAEEAIAHVRERRRGSLGEGEADRLRAAGGRAREALAAFGRRTAIRQLALFGSAIGGGLRPDSDVDLLVEFEPGHTPGLIRLAGMELELSGIFGGREIELRTYGDLSRHFRDEVRASAEP